MAYQSLTKEALQQEYAALRAKYEDYQKAGLKLDMSRGKPGPEQVSLSQALLAELATPADCVSRDGWDCRNYGVLDGIAEAKELFGELLDVPAKNIIVGGNSSLNLMYDTVARIMLFGTAGNTPWCRAEKLKFLCPVPGYDRHFAICEAFGIEMIPVPMTAEGPDMDVVENLVADPAVKGIWCVPKFANPDGTIYSDATVRRFADLTPAAPDFRIFWDNAYIVHTLDPDVDAPVQANLFAELASRGKADMAYIFTSTSKISFPGAGVSAIATGDGNIAEIKKAMGTQTIGHDKLNQLRHVKYYKNCDGILAAMRAHAAVLAPKFDAVLEILDRDLAPAEVATWTRPRGGYFISLDVLPGTAKRVYALMKDAGVTMTGAGATYPYGKDPDDKNLRIAPSYPSVADLTAAASVLAVCVRLAACEKLLAN